MASEPPDLSAFPDGTPVGEIAARLGVPVRTVREWVRRRPPPTNGSEAGTRRRSRPDVDPAEVAALYAERRSIREVAERLSCGTSTVQRRLSGAGVALRGRTDPFVDAEIVRRYEAGEPLAQCRRGGAKPRRRPRRAEQAWRCSQA